MKVIVKPPFRQTWWFIALVSSLTGFIIWSVFRMRVNELKRLEKLRLDIARNLHDDMGSQLSQLKMLSEYNAKVKGIKDFNTISEKLAEVMQNMSEIVWSINPKYDSFAITISKLVEYGIDIYEKQGIKFHLDIEESKNNVSLNLENRRHIYLIFKEAMNNSLKYSGATEVIFSVKKSGKHTILKLHDNGIGFDPTLIKLGNGLLNMQARAEAMRCVLSISSLDGGTIVELVI
jgi:signal transduction histidine kinase